MSPAVGHLFFDLPLEQRELLMVREAEIRHRMQIDETTVQAARRIMQLPPVEQERIVNALLEADTHN